MFLLGKVSTSIENHTCSLLSVCVHDIKMVEKRILGPMWTILQKYIHPERRMPLLNQIYSGCSSREAEVDMKQFKQKQIFLNETPPRSDE